MRLSPVRTALVLLVGASILSCERAPTNVGAPIPPSSTPAPRAAVAAATPRVVISQVYGGGGNSGSTFKNDFIELFNGGPDPVSVAGWSVQYASAAGSSWQVTPLTGTIPAGGYYLVQENANGGGTVSLPTPDAAANIMMAAGAGKVALVASTVPLAATCNNGSVVDQVSYGTTATDCGYRTTGTLAAATAAIRKNSGCTNTGDLSADFAVAAPTPRNTNVTSAICPALGPLANVVVRPAAVTLIAGISAQLAAIPQDAANQLLTNLPITWTSADPDVAIVDARGKVTGVGAAAVPVAITATVDDNGNTISATTQVTVNPPGSIGWVDISSSSSSFPPGFQTQLFATARDVKGGNIIPATFTFTALDPQIASIATVQNTGIVTGVSTPGDTVNRPGFRVTATPAAGGVAYTFVTHSIAIEPPQPANPAIYARNDEFGDPTPASLLTPNDMLIVRPQYTLSYNQSRGTPNWVSYELDDRQMVAGQDRCNCFTADPLLPPTAQILTSDYTSSGYDRGHMARSADRTAGNFDNATTFYLTNIVPQWADLNQGVWAQFENALGDSAKAGRAVYIVTGPLYSGSHGLTYLKGETKVAIPDSTWKVAFIGPRNAGVPFARGDVRDWSDVDGVTVLAVNMPNVQGVRNDPWSKYLTTVDKIEAATGYDILSLLPVAFQDALEAADRPPVAAFSVTGTADEGSTLTFDASASTDPDLSRSDLGRTEALSYTWHFSDGTQASGKTVTKAFADDGSYTATLTVADAFGWEKTTTQTVSVANVAPTVTLSATSAVSVLSGDPVGVSGSFTDPGADSPWQAVLDWGNGTTVPSTPTISGATVTGSFTYLAAGSYNVTLSVTDKDGAAGTQSVAFTVGRRPVPGDATPKPIDLTQRDGDIGITLYPAPQADVTTLDLTSVSIGTVQLADRRVQVKYNTKSGSSIVLYFDRAALLDAGLLTSSTTQLDLTGQLSSGVQIVSHVPVSVH